jgi:pimeloyl-ACP methyl ester carboxylesterase
MGFTTIDAGRIYFEHQRRGPVTVVLSHGWGMNLREWVNTVAKLNDAGYSTLACDHRACGRSDKNFDDVSIETLGADLAALCDHLDIARPILNG